MGESVDDLTSDLTRKLAAIAADFGERIRRATRDLSPATVSDADLQDRARRLLAQRRARSRFLPAELFHEPAWDMLLALFLAFHERRTVSVGALVTFGDAPATTSQRWIEHLHKLGLVNRVGDPVDRRRVEISLSEIGRESITGYLRHVTGS